MQGLKVGHYTSEKDKTGATVFIFDEPAIATYWQCGSSPATHELGVLELDASVTHINGLMLSGGSAHGLGAAEGVMKWLSEKRVGWPTPHGAVPIVPAAAIYDMYIETPAYPQSQDVYQACVSANSTHQSGRIGAGTGASVGKLIIDAKPMTGGLGYAICTIKTDVTVLVYVVVNCVGDVLNKNNEIIAGATSNESFVNSTAKLLAGYESNIFHAQNTTLAVILTDADFSKPALRRIAKMATAGMARAISPIFTQFDGDVIFAISLGKKSASEMIVGATAVELTQQAIMEAVKNSIIIS